MHSPLLATSVFLYEVFFFTLLYHLLLFPAQLHEISYLLLAWCFIFDEFTWCLRFLFEAFTLLRYLLGYPHEETMMDLASDQAWTAPGGAGGKWQLQDSLGSRSIDQEDHLLGKVLVEKGGQIWHRIKRWMRQSAQDEVLGEQPWVGSWWRGLDLCN